ALGTANADVSTIRGIAAEARQSSGALSLQVKHRSCRSQVPVLTEEEIHRITNARSGNFILHSENFATEPEQLAQPMVRLHW
ncbi:hypothetical protein, partial [Phyllobacterium sp. P5_D12]